MLAAPGVDAQQVVGGMVLPQGEIVTGRVYRANGSFVPSITTGADANAYLNSVPPTESFANGQPAAVVRTSVATQYVRFFTTGVTGALGGFMAPSNVVRGLTPQQVRDVLAMPFTPDSSTLVKVPAGTCVLYGTVGPVTGSFPVSPTVPAAGPWGNGGGAQAVLIGVTNDPNCQNPARVAAANFVNQQQIAGYALAYRPSAGVGNTYAVAAALDVGAFPVQFSDMDGVYNALDLLNVGPPVGLQAALKQLGGESYADFGFLRILSARAFLDVLHQQMRDVRDSRPVAAFAGAGQRAETAVVPVMSPGGTASDHLAYGGDGGGPGPAQRRGEKGGAWLSPFGGAGGLNGDPFTHSTSYGLQGLAGGADLVLAEDLVAGLSLGFSSTSFSTSIPANLGSNQALSLAGYATWSPDPWYVDAALGYAYNWGSLMRTIAFPGVYRIAQGQPVASQLLASVEGGGAVALGASTAVIPFARLEVTSASQSGFAETGAGAIGLNAAAQGTTSVRGIVGLETWRRMSILAPSDLKLRVRIGWAHDYGEVSGALTANFLGKPDTGFTVVGPQPARDSAILGVGATWSVGLGQGFVSYNGNLNQSYATHGGTLGLRLAF